MLKRGAHTHNVSIPPLYEVLGSPTKGVCGGGGGGGGGVPVDPPVNYDQFL